jgi:hypothetical protein
MAGMRIGIMSRIRKQSPGEVKDKLLISIMPGVQSLVVPSVKADFLSSDLLAQTPDTATLSRWAINEAHFQYQLSDPITEFEPITHSTQFVRALELLRSQWPGVTPLATFDLPDSGISNVDPNRELQFLFRPRS